MNTLTKRRSYYNLILVYLLLKSAGILFVKDQLIEISNNVLELVDHIVVLLIPVTSLYLLLKEEKKGYLLALTSSFIALPTQLSATIVSIINYPQVSYELVVSLILEIPFMIVTWIEYNNTEFTSIERNTVIEYMKSKKELDDKIVKLTELLIFVLLIIVSFTLAVFYVLFVIWLRDIKWDDLGLFRPNSWVHTIGSGVFFGVGWTFLMFLFNFFLVTFTGVPFTNRFADISGNLELYIGLVLSTFMLIWLEDLLIRGYFLNELLTVLRRDNNMVYVSLVLSAVVWGVSHTFQSWTGMLSIAVSGFFFSAVFFDSKGNLWIPIIMHIVYDLIAFTFQYIA